MARSCATRFLLLSIVSCIVLGPAASQAQVSTASGPVLEDRIAAVERFVERSRGRLGLPGVAVGVATRDSVLLARGFGGSTIAGAPLTGHTPIHIGSVTKTLTAAAVARLAHDGALDLDGTVETYLPGFEMGGSFEAGTVTLRHLLQHRSGLRQWDGHDRRAQEHGAFDHLSSAGAPGAQARYSSLNYMILGRILEEVSGRSYAELLERILFEPLDMTGAFVEGAGAPPEERARGHQSYFGIQIPRSEPPPPRYLVPAGFVGASAYDLARYGGMLLSAGEFGGTRVLDESTVAEILGPLVGQGSALGWGRRRIHETLVLEHSGNARTTSARMRLFPEHGYAIVVLATTNSGPFFDAADDLMDGIDAILAGRAPPEVWPKERLFKALILAGTALSVAGMIGRVSRWSEAGRPLDLEPSAGVLGRLALDLGGGALVLFGVPRLVGVPLSTMIDYFPDLGIALAVSAGSGIVGGVFRAFTRSASPQSAPSG